MGIGGVFDLSTLKKDPRSESVHSQSGGDTIPGPIRLDVTAQNLEAVIQTAMQLPVLLVFFSERSENSQTLVAKMDMLATEYKGRFQLGVVDVEAHRDVTAAFGVTAVPAAAALLQGQPIPLFQGLPDDAQLRDTVEKLLASAQQYGLNGVLDGDPDGVPAEPEVPPLHKEGLEALERGDLEAAHEAYSKALLENPGDSEAKTALYQVELLQRVAQISPSGDADGAEQILVATKDAPLTDVETHLQAADLELAFGRADAAFARLIDVVKATTGDERESVRARLIELFDVVGVHSELVTQARKALANALF